MNRLLLVCTVVAAIAYGDAAMPLPKRLATPRELSKLVLNTLDEPILLWRTDNEVLSAVWQARHDDESRASVVSIGIACPTSTLEILANERGTCNIAWLFSAW